MREIFDFLSEIFMVKREARVNIGLSQFRNRPETIVQSAEKPKVKKEVKISDLMRGIE